MTYWPFGSPSSLITLFGFEMLACMKQCKLELLRWCWWQEKGVYEKVGEATETALVVLSEKMNVTSINRTKLSRKELGTASMNAIHGMWHKDFTLEFSRDRKSMSCYCTPAMMTKLGAEPKMFVKVGNGHHYRLPVDTAVTAV